ncbi:MAG TPA: glycosyltransferase N-terminal domain-containing protein [Patescibacteria group bacterium]|nr:glycosyltransferase N-terminal domain-containing protein [Patescibacteria group bacterium]
MNIGLALYNIIVPAAAALARATAPFNPKIAEGLAGRARWQEHWRQNVASLAKNVPLIWFHVSSVGEYLQARPVIELLENRHGGNIDIALTFFSPSGMNYFTTHDRAKKSDMIRFTDYLPIDTRGNARSCLDTLLPDMIVYVKFDLWPNLIFEASRRRIPQILVSGTLAPSSRRLAFPVRRFYGNLYSSLTAIAAISDEDAGRFRLHARDTLEIVTAGDTRFDSVCGSIDSSTVALPRALTADARRFVIAGSTWPRDEAVVIPGFAEVHRRVPGAALILVPHEPTDVRIGEIARSLERMQLPFVRLSALADRETFDEPVVVADGLGYLAELYRAGFIAYVGGSFTTGVHNVMEPAVLGLPVLFGPRIKNSHEACRLVELDAASIVRTVDDFVRETEPMLRNAGLRTRRGAAGMEFIRNSCGATAHCVDLIEKHLKGGNR